MEGKASPSPKRTLLVVDGSYLMISASKMNLKINYMKLVQELERRLGCEFYEKWFINGGEGNTASSPFNNMLRAAPPAGPQFRVKILGMKQHTSYCRSCKRDVESRVQKGVDVSIATLILKHSFQNLCDQVVLVAGDGDFSDALSTAKDELRKDIVLVGFQDFTLSLDLQQLANKVLWINSFVDMIRDTPAQSPQPQQPQPVHPSSAHVYPQPGMPHSHIHPPTQMPITQPRPPVHIQQQAMQTLPQVYQQLQLHAQAPQAYAVQQPPPQPHQQQFQQQQLQHQQQLLQQRVLTNWSCSVCTFSNQPLSSNCEICLAPKPSSPIQPATTVPSNPTFPTPVPTPTSNPIFPTPTVATTNPTSPSPSVLPPTTAHASMFAAVANPVQSVSPTKTFCAPKDTTAQTPLTSEGLYPCPVCTYHRKSNSACEMCGFRA